MDLSAYQTVARLHDYYWGLCNGGLLDLDRTRPLPVRVCRDGHRTKKLVAYGTITQRPAYQSLSCSREAVYYLSTVFTEENGPHIPMRIAMTSDQVTRRTIKQSLFYQYFLLTHNELLDDPEALIGPPYPWTFDHYRDRPRTVS